MIMNYIHLAITAIILILLIGSILTSPSTDTYNIETQRLKDEFVDTTSIEQNNVDDFNEAVDQLTWSEIYTHEN